VPASRLARAAPGYQEAVTVDQWLAVQFQQAVGVPGLFAAVAAAVALVLARGQRAR